MGNVTREQILAYPPMQQVYQEFVSMLGKYVDKFNKKDKFFLVGYNNAAFDNQFLRGFFSCKMVMCILVLGFGLTQ